ncbi:MAG: DUF4124 domain-containing protein [Burkholderiales bacterium]
MDKLLFMCCFMSFSFPGIAHAEVYKWKDANGRYHYSDLKPIDDEEQKMQVPQGPTSPVSKSISEKEIEFKKRQLEAEENSAKEAKQLGEAKERQKNCEQARGNLKNLESGTRLVKYDAKGDQMYIEDNERPALIEQAKKAISDWCK